MNLRYPNLTGKTPTEQIDQLKRYLYGLVEELNLREGKDGIRIQPINTIPENQGSNGTAEETRVSPVGQFNQIKSLIIKSADIINAYSEEITRRLDGHYVAESEFGTYKEQTSQQILENSTGITRSFANIQKLEGQIEGMIAANAYVRQGLLFTVGEGNAEKLEDELGQNLADGTPVYGVEVGQTVSVDGVETFRKFARFTSYGMTLYDSNDNLSAYITDRKLNIPNAVIKKSMTRGGFKENIDADGGSVERWVGV